MLYACALEYVGNWDYNLPLVKFAYNNSYHSSIEMAPMKLYMVGGVEPPYIGTEWEKGNSPKLN